MTKIIRNNGIMGVGKSSSTTLNNNMQRLQTGFKLESVTPDEMPSDNSKSIDINSQLSTITITGNETIDDLKTKYFNKLKNFFYQRGFDFTEQDAFNIVEIVFNKYGKNVDKYLDKEIAIYINNNFKFKFLGNSELSIIRSKMFENKEYNNLFKDVMNLSIKDNIYLSDEEVFNIIYNMERKYGTVHDPNSSLSMMDKYLDIRNIYMEIKKNSNNNVNKVISSSEITPEEILGLSPMTNKSIQLNTNEESVVNGLINQATTTMSNKKPVTVDLNSMNNKMEEKNEIEYTQTGFLPDIYRDDSKDDESGNISMNNIISEMQKNIKKNVKTKDEFNYGFVLFGVLTLVVVILALK